MPHITSDNAKSVINLLAARQPLTSGDFKQALRLRDFEVKKLLRSLEESKVIIKESGSGRELFWLNESAAIDFLGRDVAQSKRLKHPKKRKSKEEHAPNDSIYR
jgi:transcription initiation factor IIE alpha subunit